MKIQNRLKAFFMAARIEYHWHCILRGRKQADRLLDRGVALNCQRLLRLNRRLMHHGMQAKQQEKAYEDMFCTCVKGSI